MKAFITVMGHDTVGVVAKVSGLCSELNINIEDVTQSILQGMFAMIMANIPCRMLWVTSSMLMFSSLHRPETFATTPTVSCPMTVINAFIVSTLVFL